MAEAEEVKKPAVNPVLIVLLVGALGAVGYFQFLAKPAVKPTTTPANTSTTTTTNTTPTPAELIAKTGATEPTTPQPDLKPTEPVLSSRDPFRAPGSSFSYKGPTTTSGSSGSNSTSNTTSTTSTDELLWKGTIKTNNGQVAIIYYQGKSYLLRIGDHLASSGYRLSEINQDSILLTSPKQPLRLRKNEGAKQ